MDGRRQALNIAFLAFGIGYALGELLTKIEHAREDAQLAKFTAMYAALSRVPLPAQPEKEKA